TTADAQDIEYKLVGAIVHLGSGLSQGHYIVIVRSADKWVIFDDDYVDVIPESDLDLYYGDSLTYGGIYVLLYERIDFDPTKYDLPGQDSPHDFKPEQPQSAKKNSDTEINPDKTQNFHDFDTTQFNKLVNDIDLKNANITNPDSKSIPESDKMSPLADSLADLKISDTQPENQNQPASLPYLNGDSETNNLLNSIPIPVSKPINKPIDIPSHSYQEINEGSSSVLDKIFDYHSSFEKSKFLNNNSNNIFDSEINPTNFLLKSKTWKIFGKKKDVSGKETKHKTIENESEPNN
ncbi:hypothetical protein BB561_006980, partial [Smittium simulii]